MPENPSTQLFAIIQHCWLNNRAPTQAEYKTALTIHTTYDDRSFNKAPSKKAKKKARR